MASKLAMDKRFDDFVMILESNGYDLPALLGLLDAKMVSAGICGLICEGRVGDVVRVFRRVEGLGIGPFELCDESVKAEFGLELRRLAKEGSFRMSVKEFVDPFKIIEMCVEKRDPDMAVSSIIREFGKKRDLVSALVVFEASKRESSGPNMYACRTIIDVCGLCGDISKARNIYEELLTQKITLNTYVFNSVMNVNANDLRYALHVYKNMQHLNVPADMVSYNILLKACCLGGRVDLAREIYEEVKQVASTGALRLDVIMYSTIIKVFADAKMWSVALQIKEDMLLAGVTPNVITWSSLISACANVGLVEKAVQVFEEMLLVGCQPNSQCCNTLLYACVEACQYDRAFRIFETWKGNVFRDNFSSKRFGGREIQVSVAVEHSSGNDIANLQCSNSGSHFPHLAEVFAFSPTTATYNILMKACGTDYYRAKTLMDEMKMEGLSPDQMSWSILIDICGRSGNVGALRNMHDAGAKPDVIAYSTAIKACVDNKNLKLAFSLFEEMKRYPVKPNLVTYNTLLRARNKYGSLHEVQQCLAIYQDMRKAGYSPNDYFLKKLIEEWCEGVIQDNNQSQGIISQCCSSKKIDTEKPQTLLLEKVAVHLHKDNKRNLVIDVRGLTKVEARIVVLAVLRMIKEKYITGDPIKDDMSIILGARKEIGGVADNEFEVKNAIVKLLQDVVGLAVVSTGPETPFILNDNRWHRRNSVLKQNECRSNSDDSSARRPTVLQRLKVTRVSLDRWLRKRMGATLC
ncbi:hypothetical protein Scep_015702 [Stephania cephalantha]|uniref:PROP1-like PPR domain-containing protein n=1 Tax=Stephania cephalantha TaxID=152367 RepID=A0AAP0J627_9MAGN